MHADLRELCSLTAHISCTANANAGKLCHSLLQNCSLHTFVLSLRFCRPIWAHQEIHDPRSLCRAGSVLNSCGM